MKILIIEDYEGDIDLLRSRLKAIGCEALVATTAEDGVRMAAAEQPALILTDLNLGSGLEDGMELISLLKADPETRAIPLIIHSVFVSHASDIPEVQAQTDGFLPKPYRFVELSSLIARVRDADPRHAPKG